MRFLENIIKAVHRPLGFKDSENFLLNCKSNFVEWPISGRIGTNSVPLIFEIYLDLNNICNLCFWERRGVTQC